MGMDGRVCPKLAVPATTSNVCYRSGYWLNANVTLVDSCAQVDGLGN